MNKKSLTCSLSILGLSMFAVSWPAIPKAITNTEITESLTSTTNIIYTPPSDQRTPTSETNTSGTRGGCEEFLRKTTLLVPRSHVGQTLSLTPTLAWHMPEHEEPVSLEIRIFAFDDQIELSDEESQLIKQEAQSGLNQLDLSQTSITLESDRKYLWELKAKCSSGNLTFSAEIDTSSHHRAEQSHWYDILHTALQNPQKQQNLDDLLAALITFEESKIKEIQLSNPILAAQIKGQVNRLTEINTMTNLSNQAKRLKPIPN